MRKKFFYTILILFLSFIFQEKVFAKEVAKECKYTSYMAIDDEGKMIADETYRGDVISFVLYDDLSYSVSGKPAGKEDILNWGKDTKYFDNIKDSRCMDYIVVMNTTFWGGLDYYGVNEKDLLEKGKVAANGEMQFDKVYVFKNDDKEENNLGVYSCQYQFYTIVVDRNDKKLSIRSLNNGTLNLTYIISEELKNTWFSKERETDECLPTVSCYNKMYPSGLTEYYVFNDAMEAAAAGYKKCDNKDCTGDDCNPSEISYSCTTYTKYLNEIDSLYSQIKSSTGDVNNLYTEVHTKEKRLGTLCNGVMASYDYSENCVKACVHVDSDIAAIKDKYGINSPNSANANCSLSSRLVAWIMKIINWIRYIVPVLLILLSILDYIKAIASDSEDEVKKVTGRFVKRLIVAVCIFLVPLILQFLLGIFGIDANNFCL